MKILAIYDRPEVVDRYTVYFNIVEKTCDGKKLYNALAMDDTPFYALGFCQHVTGMLGRHNGKKITLRDLPKDCLVALVKELQDD